MLRQAPDVRFAALSGRDVLLLSVSAYDPKRTLLSARTSNGVMRGFASTEVRILMPKYLGALTIVLLLGMVLTRISVLRRQGIKAAKFGNIDKTDFLIPPFALFYFYILFAAAFHWPTVTTHQFFHSEIISWIGVLLCLAGLLLFLWSLISFRQSFRVGIDADHPDRLITDGVFAFSRNPIYVAFAIILIGEFFIFPNWISLIYLVAATWLFHRQVLREEEYLGGHYGQAYAEYRRRVRRYV
jgi:protein-S-isoprenylcysteine O-methyltransferase Ste14